MRKNSNKNWPILICLILAIITFAVYYQVHKFDFVNFDDSGYVFGNPNVRAGITLKSIQWAFTSGYASNWHPLTWLSHMLDWQLFGNDAGVHHLTNLFFHIVNTLLLFVVLKQMTKAVWQSAFVAALFAFHPLHVESVAWVSERKDVLSMFFWILTMWAYLRYVKEPKFSSYFLVVIFFALGLMSKPMLVTLPFVLLLLDYWPLERFGKRTFFCLVREKIPMFAMVLASSVITFLVQRKGGAMASTEQLDFSVRFANAAVSYLKYIGKMFWPSGLAVFYPHPRQNISVFDVIMSITILLAITILIFRFAKKHRYLFTGWFWYLGTLVPVSGLVQVGEQSMADRYTYIPLTGLFIIIAWGLNDLSAKWKYRKITLGISAPAVLLILAVCAWIQAGYWRNSITLFEHTLAVTKDNYTAHSSIEMFFYEQGELEKAIYHCSEALRIKPDWTKPMNNLAWYLAVNKGTVIYDPDKAVRIALRACELTKYQEPEILDTLAAAYAATGDFAKAVETAQKAMDLCRTDEQCDFAEQIESRLALFKAGKPYVETR